MGGSDPPNVEGSQDSRTPGPQGTRTPGPQDRKTLGALGSRTPGPQDPGTPTPAAAAPAAQALAVPALAAQMKTELVRVMFLLLFVFFELPKRPARLENPGEPTIGQLGGILKTCYHLAVSNVMG